MTARDTLARWRADPVAFASEACVITRPDNTRGEPILSPRQQAALRALARPEVKTAALIWPKRSGKTLLAALALLWASLKRDAVSVALSNSERQAAALAFQKAGDILKDSPKLQGLAEIKQGVIEFPQWGASITVLPCNRRTVAGITVTGLLHSDELWAAPSEEPYFLLAGQSEQGKVLLTSQSSGLASHVHALWKQAQEGDPDPSLFVDYCRFETLEEAQSGYPNPYLAADFLRKQQREMPVALFRPYFLGWWAETAGGLFSAEDVERCFDWPETSAGAAWTFWRQRWERAGYRVQIGAGLDRALPSAQKDASVWSVVAAVTGRDQVTDYYLLYQEVLPTGREAEVLAAYRACRSMFGDFPSFLETYNAGDLVEKIPRASLKSPTAQAQQVLFGRLCRAVQEGRLHVSPDNLTLRAQLLSMQVDVTKALPSYGAPGTAADDTVYSLAWAMAAAEEGGGSGWGVIESGSTWAVPRTLFSRD